MGVYWEYWEFFVPRVIAVRVVLTAELLLYVVFSTECTRGMSRSNGRNVITPVLPVSTAQNAKILGLGTGTVYAGSSILLAVVIY